MIAMRKSMKGDIDEDSEGVAASEDGGSFWPLAERN
jgi:hypothetical protein